MIFFVQGTYTQHRTIMDRKRTVYHKAKRLGYKGPIEYIGSTAAQWEAIVNDLEIEKAKNYQNTDETRETPSGLPPMYQENVDPNRTNFRSVGFPMVDMVGNNILTEDNLEAVKDTSAVVLDEVKNQVENLGPVYQLKYVMMDGKAFSTHYHRDTDKVVEEANHWLETFTERYDTGFGDNILIDYISVGYIINADKLIKGSYKNIEEANTRWYMPHNNTKTNCFYISVYTCLNWNKQTNLLTDSNKRMKCAEKWKNRIEGLPEHMRYGVTYSDLPAISVLLDIHLIVYNNIYEKIGVYNTESRRVVTIKIANDHATPMIERKEIDTIISGFMCEAPVHDESVVKNKIIRKTKRANTHDTRYVSWDIETYVEDNDTTQLHAQGQEKCLRVYASGLAYHEGFDINAPIICKQMWGDADNLKTFIAYVKENIEIFSDTTFYAHNGGRFDLLLLLRDALLADETIEILSKGLLELDNSFIGLAIKYNTKIVKFKDSYRLFQAGLAKITKEFKVSTPKGYIDHETINANTFENHKEAIIEYHRADCVGLLECLDKFSKFAFDTFKINITDCYTAASFSKRINKTCYMNTKQPVYRLSTQIDRYIRQAYLGGRNECFVLGVIPGPKYYYDFTSLYPFVGTLMLPVGKPVYQTYKSIEEALRLNSMGFIKCRVTGTKEDLKGVLPLHGLHRDSRFIFPYIETPTEMILFTAEIREGLKLGYKYEPIDGYAFMRDFLMKNFFSDCSKYKQIARAAGDESIASMWKIIINSGYGFWGYNAAAHDTIKMYPRGSSGYLEPLSKGLVRAISVAKGYVVARVSNDKQPNDTNVSIASAITSYARITLYRAMLDIQSKGGLLYYCDTDSIICNVRLSDHPDLIKKWRKDLTGDALGSLKNELGLTADKKDNCLETLIIAGCKMYSAMGLNASSRVVEFNKLKGYKASKDYNVSQELMTDMVNGSPVTQTQTQLQCNKSDFMRDGQEFQIRINEVKKSFKSLYTKGVAVETELGYKLVEPLVI